MSASNAPTISRWPQARSAPPWRDRGARAQFAVQVVIFGFAGFLDFGAAVEPPHVWQSVLRIGGQIVVFAALLVQRYSAGRGIPMAALGLALVGSSASGSMTLEYGLVAYEAWYISAYSARHRRWLVLLAVGSVLSILNFVMFSSDDVDLTSSLMVVIGLCVMALVTIAFGWQLGLATRRRERDVSELAAKAELAALAERTRIAREMHDIVAHSLTAIIAQADGGRYVARKDVNQAVSVLETIGDTGREALVQMRQLLSILRDNDSRSMDSTPGLSGIPSLVAGVESDGLRVDFQQQGQPRDIGESAGLTVYRIVQESLTNVLKHAGSTEALIRFDWNPDTLTIHIDNAPGDGLLSDWRTEGNGRGLKGIRERAELLGGAADWGESEIFDSGFAVRVEVPL